MNRRRLPGAWKFRRRPPKSVWVVLLLVALASLRGFGLWPGRHAPPSPPQLREAAYRVERVVDGDTIIVLDGDKRVRVRLLGIDTPETVKEGTPVQPWGPEATAFTEAFLAGGQAYLRLDRRRVDRYGRALAYVFVDEVMLNEELVRAGLARADPYTGDSAAMTRRLYKAQDEAKAAGRGVWSE